MKKFWIDGMNYYQEGKYEKAITEVEKILEFMPNHPQTIAFIKKLKMEMKQEAEKHYTNGLKAYHEERLADAVKELETAVRLDPQNEEIQKALEETKIEFKLRKGR